MRKLEREEWKEIESVSKGEGKERGKREKFEKDREREEEKNGKK